MSLTSFLIIITNHFCIIELEEVDPAQPNTNFDEFKDMYKIK